MSGPIDAVASPCVRLCTLDDQRVCRGCFRHIDEIVGWLAADDAQRRRIIARATRRRRDRGFRDPG